MGYNYLNADSGFIRNGYGDGASVEILKKKEGEIYDPMGIFDYRS